VGDAGRQANRDWMRIAEIVSERNGQEGLEMDGTITMLLQLSDISDQHEQERRNIFSCSPVDYHLRSSAVYQDTFS
jgi:hypothetical protein